MLKTVLHAQLDASRERVSKPFRACWVLGSARPWQFAVLQADVPAAGPDHCANGSS